jgi:cytochrome c biogenesis protein CcmG, thiol:disulfide interchange protein DsbE
MVEHLQSPLSPRQAPPSNRRWVIFGLALVPVAAFVALMAWGIATPSNARTNALVNNEPGVITAVSREAADFSLEPLEGGTPIVLSDLRGKVVLVDFWSSWCPPCRAEAADLASVYKEYDGQPVEFIGVAMWDNKGDAIQHLERYDVTYLNGVDPRGAVALDYGVRGLPEKYFVDQQGMIVRTFTGPMSPELLRTTLNEILSGS